MCDCTVCTESKTFDSLVDKAPIEIQEQLRNFYDAYAETQMDRDYYKSIVQNTWPSSAEVLARYREVK
jgi:hypothetical protein